MLGVRVEVVNMRYVRRAVSTMEKNKELESGFAIVNRVDI